MTFSLPLSALADRLARRCDLSQIDRDALLSLPNYAQTFEKMDWVGTRDGVPTSHLAVVEEGFVTSSKQVGTDREQIVQFILPGDILDLSSFTLGKGSLHARAQAETTVRWIKHSDLHSLIADHPTIAKALWLESVVECNTAREWMANIGKRKAPARLIHLFLETATRYEAIGGFKEGWFPLPIPQHHLGNALSLSMVHVNKSLATLRRLRLIDYCPGRMCILDLDAAARFTKFDSAYLHLKPTKT